VLKYYKTECAVCKKLKKDGTTLSM